MSEWLSLMASLGTADIEVHIIHVITTYTLELLFKVVYNILNNKLYA